MSMRHRPAIDIGVVGHRDGSGHTIDLTGPDPYILLERARVRAKELIWRGSSGSMDLTSF